VVTVGVVFAAVNPPVNRGGACGGGGGCEMCLLEFSFNLFSSAISPCRVAMYFAISSNTESVSFSFFWVVEEAVRVLAGEVSFCYESLVYAKSLWVYIYIYRNNFLSLSYP